MDQQKTYEEIELYLNGKLDKEALANFEQRLGSDVGLAARLNLFKNLDEALSDEKAMKVQKQVHDLGEEFFTASETSATIRRLPFYQKPLSIAATVLVLVAAGIFWWQSSNNAGLSNDVLFADHFETYPLSNLVRGSDDPETFYADAIQKYQSGNYKSAENSFLSLLSQKPDDMVAAFGLANAYLNEQPPKLDLALRHFQQVIEDGNSVFVPKAQWYSALIYLKKRKKEKAKSLLEEIKDLDKNAKRLLEKLN